MSLDTGCLILDQKSNIQNRVSSIILTGEILKNNSRKQSRRKFIKTSAAIGSAALLSPNFISLQFSNGSRTELISQIENSESHPRIYLTSEPIPGLRSISQLKETIQEGHAKILWENILQKARADIDAESLTPASMFPGRNEGAAKHNNPDWTVCNEAGQRILRAALVHLIIGDSAYKNVALRQMEALFDKNRWQKWLDGAHERFGHSADLRTGMLSLDVALAFDWLYPSLSQDEKDFIIEGIDRQGIQPYLQSIEQNPWWIHDLNNWLTVIVGGLGIAGMALGKNHPDSQKLIDISVPLMQKYLGIYGSEGEFNESVAYANATKLVVNYYLAKYYWSKGGENRLAPNPLPQACYWKMYLTLPPGRVAAFGDAHVDAAPEVKYIAAVASAVRDPILQWFYLQNAPQKADPLQLLWYDPTLEPENPEGKLPLGKAFVAHGACMSSRTDWNSKSTACVVYGKAGREENHEHNDIGQLCIDGYGERLIVDLGSPSAYPEDFFEANRWKYYNASVRGHNILMFGGREMRVPSRDRGEKFGEEFKKIQGKIVESNFNDKAGGYWRIDLTGAYEGVKTIYRTVVHLFPGIVAVLDEAELEKEEEISLRWHTIDRCEPDADGNFIVLGERAKIIGKVINLGEEKFSIQRNEHEYQPPFDRDRLGDPLEQRRESFIEAKLIGKSCRLLSLFAVAKKTAITKNWNLDKKDWSIQINDGLFKVKTSENELTVMNLYNGNSNAVNLY